MTTLRSGHPTGKPAAGRLRILLGLWVLLAGCAPNAPSASATPADRVAGLAITVPGTLARALPTPTRRQPSSTAPSTLRSRRLTSGGCCAHPIWLPDSQWIAFVDKPAPELPVGIYGVPADGGEPVLLIEPVGLVSQDWTHLAYHQNGQTAVRSLIEGDVWMVPNQGRAVWLSPSGRFTAWQSGSRGITHPDLRERVLWLAETGTTTPQELVRVRGGGLVGWSTGEAHVIVTGQLGSDGPAGIWRIEPERDRAVLLVEAQRPRDPLISPGGSWLAFYTAFDSGPIENGLWVVRTDGTQLGRVDLFGAYRWRSEGQLLVIPIEDQDPGLSLWQVDAVTGEASRLTNPWREPLHIRGNDWQISPDGSRMVYVSSGDGNVWVMELPEP